MIFGTVTKYKGWKWWYRFVKPIKYVYVSGCMSNNCDDSLPEEEGCQCNNFHAVRKALKKRGWKLVGDSCGRWSSYWRFIYAKKDRIIIENHTCGR
jgi:hypothetical protein